MESVVPVHVYGRVFLFARHGQTPEALEETLTPNQREVNARATALLVTVGWEGSLSKYVVHSESEPKLAWRVGNLAKSGNAQNLDSLLC